MDGIVRGEADYRRVAYIGTHPMLYGTVGISYFDLKHDRDLYRPDEETGVESEWWRVDAENLATIR
jgi:hypothetical protein